MIPYNISDLSLTFFAKGKPWNVPSDALTFQTIRSALLAGGADVDELVRLADQRTPLIDAGLEFVGNEIVHAGRVLHNTWVDKILAFKAKDEPFAPIFNALDDLVRNPTPEAIERLPIFVERSGLGFLPDGRITGFKGVKDDYFDIHTGHTFKYEVGAKIEMPRENCNADPNQTCSTGLHIGALDYVKQFVPQSHRIMLTAFWPRDVVAVPVDYNGGKIRVSKLEVIDEVDKKFVDEFLAANRTTVQGYLPPEPPKPPAWQTAKVGDYVTLIDIDGTDLAGAKFQVVTLDPDDDTDTRLKVQDYEGTRQWMSNDDIDAIVTETSHPALFAEYGDEVEIEGQAGLPNGTYRVSDVDDDNDDERLLVDDNDDDGMWVDNDKVKRIVRETLGVEEEEPDWSEYSDYDY